MGENLINFMANEPVICFGQQPNGFSPKRYLYAKIKTARELQKKIGGRIVFFYHDSDADYRETITILEDMRTKAEVRLNFKEENKIQKKYSPLYAKKILPGWQEEMLRQLPRFMDKSIIDIFGGIQEKTVADFCLSMYKKLGLLEGIEIARSGDKDFRNKADELKKYFADVEYEGEIVRAQIQNGKFMLHAGGGKYLDISASVLPLTSVEKWQKSPARAERFAWMQSVIHCTHYIAGESEADYLNKADFPEVFFVDREKIEKSEYAYITDN